MITMRPRGSGGSFWAPRFQRSGGSISMPPHEPISAQSHAVVVLDRELPPARHGLTIPQRASGSRIGSGLLWTGDDRAHPADQVLHDLLRLCESDLVFGLGGASHLRVPGTIAAQALVVAVCGQ